MKTAQSIEEQESRKAGEKNGVSDTQNSVPVSAGRQRQLAALKPWKPGQSGNPGGKPKVDLAAEIARAIFQNDAEAIYNAYSAMMRKGSPYAFQVLSERAFGKLKETHQLEIRPYQDLTAEELEKRIEDLQEQERQLGIAPALPPAKDDIKPN